MEDEETATMSAAATSAQPLTDFPDELWCRLFAFLALVDLPAFIRSCRACRQRLRDLPVVYRFYLQNDSNQYRPHSAGLKHFLRGQRLALPPATPAPAAAAASSAASGGCGSDSSDGISWREVCKGMVAFARHGYSAKGINLVHEACGASSTDHESQAPRETVLPNRSFWSSVGSKTADSHDHITYKLIDACCVVTRIRIYVYQALFQKGRPTYGPRRVRVSVGTAPDRFHYTSDPITLDNTPALQKITLSPAVVLGGYVRLTLEGKQTTQPGDELWYVCLRHVAVVGLPVALLPNKALRHTLRHVYEQDMIQQQRQQQQQASSQDIGSRPPASLSSKQWHSLEEEAEAELEQYIESKGIDQATSGVRDALRLRYQQFREHFDGEQEGAGDGNGVGGPTASSEKGDASSPRGGKRSGRVWQGNYLNRMPLTWLRANRLGTGTLAWRDVFGRAFIEELKYRFLCRAAARYFEEGLGRLHKLIEDDGPLPSLAPEAPSSPPSSSDEEDKDGSRWMPFSRYRKKVFGRPPEPSEECPIVVPSSGAAAAASASASAATAAIGSSGSFPDVMDVEVVEQGEGRDRGQIVREYIDMFLDLTSMIGAYPVHEDSGRQPLPTRTVKAYRKLTKLFWQLEEAHPMESSYVLGVRQPLPRSPFAPPPAPTDTQNASPSSPSPPTQPSTRRKPLTRKRSPTASRPGSRRPEEGVNGEASSSAPSTSASAPAAAVSGQPMDSEGGGEDIGAIDANTSGVHPDVALYVMRCLCALELHQPGEAFHHPPWLPPKKRIDKYWPLLQPERRQPRPPSSRERPVSVFLEASTRRMRRLWAAGALGLEVDDTDQDSEPSKPSSPPRRREGDDMDISNDAGEDEGEDDPDDGFDEPEDAAGGRLRPHESILLVRFFQGLMETKARLYRMEEEAINAGLRRGPPGVPSLIRRGRGGLRRLPVFGRHLDLFDMNHPNANDIVRMLGTYRRLPSPGVELADELMRLGVGGGRARELYGEGHSMDRLVECAILSENLLPEVGLLINNYDRADLRHMFSATRQIENAQLQRGMEASPADFDVPPGLGLPDNHPFRLRWRYVNRLAIAFVSQLGIMQMADMREIMDTPVGTVLPSSRNRPLFTFAWPKWSLDDF